MEADFLHGDEYYLWGNEMPIHPTKIMLLAGACMVLALPANAAINWSGYGELGGGGMPDSSPLYSTPLVLAGGAHVNAAFESGLNLQFDVEGTRDFFDITIPAGSYYDSPGLNRDKMTKYGVGIHLALRGDQYRLGGLASIGNSDWAHYNNRLVTVGVEGTWFLDRTTLFSQLTYSRAVQGEFAGTGLDSPYLYTGARYFFRDNLMFEADAGAGTIESNDMMYTRTDIGPVNTTVITSDTNYNGNALHWSTKIEYRFQDLPVSLAFDYRGSYATWSHWHTITASSSSGANFFCNASFTVHRTENLFMVKLRYYFGQDSLIANDRNGASISDYNPWYGVEPVSEGFAGNLWALYPPPSC